MRVERPKAIVTCVLSFIVASPALIAWGTQYLYLHHLFIRPNAWWWDLAATINVLDGFFGWIVPVVCFLPATVNSVREDVPWYLRGFPWVMVALSACAYWYIFKFPSPYPGGKI